MTATKISTKKAPKAPALKLALPVIEGVEAPADAVATVTAVQVATYSMPTPVRTKLVNIGAAMRSHDEAKAKAEVAEQTDWLAIADLYVEQVRVTGAENGVRAAFMDVLGTASGRNVATVQLSAAKTVGTLFPPTVRKQLPTGTAFSTLRKLGQGVNKQNGGDLTKNAAAVASFVAAVTENKQASLPAPKAMEIAQSIGIIPKDETPAPAPVDGREGPKDAASPKVLLAGGATEAESVPTAIADVSKLRNIDALSKHIAAAVHSLALALAVEGVEVPEGVVITLTGAKAEFDSLFG